MIYKRDKKEIREKTKMALKNKKKPDYIYSQKELRDLLHLVDTKSAASYCGGPICNIINKDDLTALYDKVIESVIEEYTADDYDPDINGIIYLPNIINRLLDKITYELDENLILDTETTIVIGYNK